ncbi:MAG: dienelactone hydrolase family protein [Bacillota bacterium]
MKPVIGEYHPLAQWAMSECPYSLSYLAHEWPDVDTWRSTARSKVLELLSYQPPETPLNPRVERKEERDGVVVELISYEQPFGPRTEGYLLYPAKRSGRLPGVVALHDHGGFKYYGKEKIVALDHEPEILRKFKKESYEGRSWANELAARGYVVFVPDLFLWGSRKMAVESFPDAFVHKMSKLEQDSDEYIKAYNGMAGQYETLIAKTLFLAGTTWPGIALYDDRRAIDYLVSRDEVDPERIGCGGLSGGGLRTILLSALDGRIKCAVCVGFMSTFREVVANKVTYHTWMMHIPHLPRYLDMPDLASLHAPLPFMCQYDEDDPLWTLEGQRQADEKLSAVYAKMGSADSYAGRFYPGPHKFDIAMQEDAFDWFDKWLAN